MAFVHLNNTVGTTATKIAQIPTGQRQNITVFIQNQDSQPIFIGDDDVAASGATVGHRVASNAAVQFWCNSGDVIYAISAAGTTAGSVTVTYSA
jgi:hypothetical protein